MALHLESGPSSRRLSRRGSSLCSERHFAHCRSGSPDTSGRPRNLSIALYQAGGPTTSGRRWARFGGLRKPICETTHYVMQRGCEVLFSLPWWERVRVRGRLERNHGSDAMGEPPPPPDPPPPHG